MRTLVVLLGSNGHSKLLLLRRKYAFRYLSISRFSPGGLIHSRYTRALFSSLDASLRLYLGERVEVPMFLPALV